MATRRSKRLQPVKPGRAQRLKYLDALRAQVDVLRAQTGNLSNLLASGATRTEVARALAAMSGQAQAQVDALAPTVAQSFVTDVDRQNKRETERTVARALSVDFARVVDDDVVRGELDLAVVRNTALIRTIPAEHWGLVGQAVLDNYAGKELPEGVSLAQRLRDIGGITERRAAFIARDQTAKLTGSLNQSRQQANGIEEYEWRTSGQDRRVVGNPGGLYPKGTPGHEDHYARNGKVFRWDSPPSDGHPGQAYNCRCVALPRVNLKALAAKYGVED